MYSISKHIVRGVILFIGMTFSILSTYAQDTRITVIDGTMGEPVPYAHVKFTDIETSKSEIVLTDDRGFANLPSSHNYAGLIAIHITYIGFKTHDDTIQKGSSIKVKLAESIANLQQLVVTGEFSASSPEKALHKITLISRDKIDALNAVSLDQVLARELNMSISKDGVLGSSISIQGLSGENVKILIDGVPMIGRLNGNIDLSQINLNDIERIEVVEGPLSVSYGSNALAGTINLITKKDQQKPVSVNAKYYGENIGTHNIDGRIGLKKNQYFGSINLTRNFFDGWNIGDPVWKNPDPIADSSRVKLWKPRRQYLAGIKLGKTLKNGSILYNINGFDEKIINRGTPRGPYGESAFDDHYLTQRLDNSINLNVSIDTVNQLNVLAAYNLYERKREAYITDLTGVTTTPNNSKGVSDTTKTTLMMLRSTYTGKPEGKSWRYQVGLDLNNEIASGERIKDKKQSIGDYAGFVSFEWQPTFKWTIRPGVRMSYNTQYGSPVVPSLYAKYQLKPSMAIRGSIARGFRAPSVKELYMDFVDVNHNIQGNNDLKAETAVHTSVNYSYTRLKKGKTLKIKMGLFYNQIQNKITLAQSSSTLYSYANVEEALSLGFNVEGQYYIGHLKTSLGFSYTGTQNNLANSEVKPDVGYSPQMTSSLTYDFKKIKSDISLFWKYSGQVPQIVIDANDNLQQSFIDSYSLLDLTANKKFWKNRIIFGLGVKNILNVTNISSSGSGSTHGGGNTRPIAPGRVYFVKLGFQL
jgi:outer membrane receptor for ferrienterochelin and colicins